MSALVHLKIKLKIGEIVWAVVYDLKVNHMQVTGGLTVVENLNPSPTDIFSGECHRLELQGPSELGQSPTVTRPKMPKNGTGKREPDIDQKILGGQAFVSRLLHRTCSEEIELGLVKGYKNSQKCCEAQVDGRSFLRHWGAGMRHEHAVARAGPRR